MDAKKIERINELARLKKERALTEEELSEQAALRKEYLDGYRREMQVRMAEVEAEASDLVPQLAVSLKEHVNAFTDKLIAFGER